MSIQQRVLEKLEFDKLLQRLAGLCLLPVAAETAKDLFPDTELESVRIRLEETEEGKELLRQNPLFSVRGAKEIRAYLKRCERGGILSPEELLHIRDTLKAGRQVKQGIAENKLELRHLGNTVQGVEPQKGLEDEITRCVTEEGVIADNASPLLAELRRSQSRLQQKIRESLEGILRSQTYQKMLQDPLITQRSERYVVPVKQEYRGSFPGIMHDQSASGATLFIEPAVIVNLGNQLREVLLKENREIQRILQQLSANIENTGEKIAVLYRALGHVDFILAKAHLAEEMNAGAPKLAEDRIIRLVQARHPLIAGNPVPLTVNLGDNFDTLVITGPNTGGKTVALKTIGLCALMTQAGLHIPAESDSCLGVFTQVFADIGDEQSVEQSLSTFSGHIKNIVEIVNQADHRSLVLLDEVGAGTDPTEGAALAMAILSELHERGSKTVATTHYGALKTFAYRTPRVENASVEFDPATLRPTYRLLVGIPGKSNAFNVAARWGLSAQVLSRARDFVAEREMQVADLIENLEDTQREIEAEKRRMVEERQAAEAQTKVMERKTLQIEERYETVLAKAKDEAAEIIRQAKREAEELIAELKEALKKEHKQQQDIELARQGVKRMTSKVEQKTSQPASGVKPEQISLGQMVYMTKVRQKGQVLLLPNEHGDVVVQAGIMKVTVPLHELRLVQEEPEKKPKSVTGTGRLSKAKTEMMRNELDIRGMLVEEAEYALDKYLDDCILAGVRQIYVIHGKGTGALRTGVQDFLRGHPHVQSFRLGQHGEGDLGVTVVELK